MPKAPPTALEKTLKQQQNLEKAKKQYQLALNERKDELFQIFAQCNSITAIDDSLLAGFLLFAANPQNKDNPLLAQMKELAKAAKIPYKPKYKSKKQSNKSN